MAKQKFLMDIHVGLEWEATYIITRENIDKANKYLELLTASESENIDLTELNNTIAKLHEENEL